MKVSSEITLDLDDTLLGEDIIAFADELRMRKAEKDSIKVTASTVSVGYGVGEHNETQVYISHKIVRPEVIQTSIGPLYAPDAETGR